MFRIASYVFLLCVIGCLQSTHGFVLNKPHHQRQYVPGPRCPAEKPFSCLNGLRCLRMNDVCDSYNDCDDGSDELECGEPHGVSQLPVPAPIATVTEQTECPSAFVFVSEIGKCYKLESTEMNWHAAGQHCASIYGAHLVFIGSVAEQRAIEGLLRSHPETIWWTGGERIDGSWGWKYHCADGSIRSIAMRYRNWAEGEPNNSYSSESCIAVMNMAWWEGRWNDDGCTKPRRFICEIDVTQ